MVASSLGKGGAERATALQSKMLSSLGYQVYIVIVHSIIEYDYSGTIYDLGRLKEQGVNRVSRLNHFRRFINKHDFYAIIDNRSRVQAYREFIVSKFIYKKPTIYVIHSYESSITFNKYKVLNYLLYRNELMVGVSSEISEHFKKLYQLKHVRTIHNALDFERIQQQGKEQIEDSKILNSTYVIFYGRVDNSSKNLRLLFQAYKKSKLIQQGVKLLILGKGPDVKTLKSYSEELKISDSVIFKTALRNPFPYVKQALFMILTSRYEGFPMVLLESLSLAVPVISVDCKSGPSEIIKHGYNGLLVENDNVKKLSQAMDSFIFNKQLYETCKANTVKSIRKYRADEIIKQWQVLLKSL
ncbi:glycosyltransferase [Mangrovimonas yunxiaonensis]|uniref:glycosyltransferase n=1 Tax=Mangrovimonas yunxiaonensis TaxID=1197477 RepID=UPI0010403CA7|nr:glycosyltransferase [Mangrovimonas yunxiaonensis]